MSSLSLFIFNFTYSYLGSFYLVNKGFEQIRRNIMFRGGGGGYTESLTFSPILVSPASPFTLVMNPQNEIGPTLFISI